MVCKNLEVSHFTVPYFLQSNGAAERVGKKIHLSLTSTCSGKELCQQKCIDLLSLV